jgi:HTH-type transcriptional regulator/antitoxin HigA
MKPSESRMPPELDPISPVEPAVPTAPVPTPGEAIKAELERRGWTHDDLARVLGRHRPEVTSLISGKRLVTPEIAIALGAAFGNPPEYWLGLEAAKQLSLIPEDGAEIARRVRAFQLAPINDMERRGWLRPTTDPADLEAQLCRFFNVQSLEQEPVLTVHARKTERLSPLNIEQRAWAFRARQLAAALPVADFDDSRMESLGRKLRELAAYPEEVRHVPRVLAEHGIRFVVVEPLKGGGIDGAAFWLNERSPVIALSVKVDRVDAFWFTLCHELSHVRHRDAESVDTDLYGEDAPKQPPSKAEFERRADAEAASLLIPAKQIESFIARVGPLYSKTRLVQFAHVVKIHPGIIVGQLQHRGEIKYGANREMLVKIRERVTSTAVTDGWKKSVGTV